MAAPYNSTMLALTFDRYHDGYTSSKVAPHITVLPWFQPGELNVAEAIKSVLVETFPIEVFKGEPTVAGGQGYEKASMAVISPPLHDLHRKLYHQLNGLGVTFASNKWLEGTYNPHYRIGPVNPFEGVGSITFNALTLVRNVFDPTLGYGVKHYRNLPPL